jgi:hypothetical protein
MLSRAARLVDDRHPVEKRLVGPLISSGTYCYLKLALVLPPQDSLCL